MNADLLQKLKDEKENFILAIWHQNLFQGIFAQTTVPFVVIVSRSSDAEPVAFACRKLKHFVARGSSRSDHRDKGGPKAKNEMIEILRKGHPGAITVDGPKGPPKKVKSGIIDMAIKSNAVIVPYCPMPSSFWEFKSWDKFRLPKPFSKILVAVGEPLKIEEGAPLVDSKARVEKSINELEKKVSEELKNWHHYQKNNFS